MKTIKEIAMDLLLNGEHINKSEFHSKYHTFTLTQRIEEIRRIDGWNIKAKTIPGRKGMVEYWLEDAEIKRIQGGSKERKDSNEQSVEPTKTAPVTASEKPINESYEQLGLGLLGGHNY